VETVSSSSSSKIIVNIICNYVCVFINTSEKLFVFLN